MKFGEVYSNRGLPRDTIKILNKNLILYLKDLTKEEQMSVEEKNNNNQTTYMTKEKNAEKK